MVQAAKGNDRLPTGFTEQLMNLARSKLMGLPNVHQSFEKYTPNAKLAIIDVRVQLDYEPKHEVTTDRVAQLVASHMRTAFSVLRHRKYMRSGYPSEAWLAEAAAQEMQHLLKRQPTFAFDTLDELLESGIIEIGERGEVIARVIMLHAYDRAVQRASPRSDPIRFSRGCLLTEFIECMFSEEAAKEVLDSRSHDAGSYNGNKLTFRERFKKARVRFTHFERLHDQNVLSAMGCVLGMMRCAAFVAQRGEEGRDMAIPIILDAERLGSDLLTKDNMTAILIQIKNRCEPGTIASNVITLGGSEDVPFFSGGSQPYISLVMELGVLPRQLIEQEKQMWKDDISFPKKVKKATKAKAA